MKNKASRYREAYEKALKGVSDNRQKHIQCLGTSILYRGAGSGKSYYYLKPVQNADLPEEKEVNRDHQ